MVINRPLSASSNTIRGILPVQSTHLTIFFHNLCPGFLWSTSWPGTLHFVLHTYIHPIIVCFAIRKISFCWFGSFKSLAHSFCLFPFAKEITLFAFCLLFLYSLHAYVDFSFFPISILFLLFPYCFSNFLIPQPCSFCPNGPFVTCAVYMIIFFICCQF